MRLLLRAMAMEISAKEVDAVRTLALRCSQDGGRPESPPIQ